MWQQQAKLCLHTHTHRGAKIRQFIWDQPIPYPQMLTSRCILSQLHHPNLKMLMAGICLINSLVRQCSLNLGCYEWWQTGKGALNPEIQIMVQPLASSTKATLYSVPALQVAGNAFILLSALPMAETFSSHRLECNCISEIGEFTTGISTVLSQWYAGYKAAEEHFIRHSKFYTNQS